jgi:ribonuclease VapC
VTVPALVTDTSAWIAIQRAEPEASVFANLIGSAHTVLIAAPTRLECFVVALRAQSLTQAHNLMALIAAARAETVPFDDDLLALAQDAYARFGRGNGAGGALNLGDCFAYALAKSRGLPLLFKGEDFRATDVEAAA